MAKFWNEPNLLKTNIDRLSNIINSTGDEDVLNTDFYEQLRRSPAELALKIFYIPDGDLQHIVKKCNEKVAEGRAEKEHTPYREFLIKQLELTLDISSNYLWGNRLDLSDDLGKPLILKTVNVVNNVLDMKKAGQVQEKEILLTIGDNILDKGQVVKLIEILNNFAETGRLRYNITDRVSSEFDNLGILERYMKKHSLDVITYNGAEYHVNWGLLEEWEIGGFITEYPGDEWDNTLLRRLAFRFQEYTDGITTEEIEGWFKSGLIDCDEDITLESFITTYLGAVVLRHVISENRGAYSLKADKGVEN